MAFTEAEPTHDQLSIDAFDTSETLVPLKALRLPFREDLFRHVAVQTVFEGDVVFEEGSYDHQHIYLHSGELELQYGFSRSEILSASDSTLPIAHQQPRPCRCVAKTDCALLRFDSDRVDRTLSWSQISDYLLSELSLQPDYDEDIEWMQTVLNSNLFLKTPPVNSEYIFSRITPMVVQEDEVVIRQGDMGDCCYFIKEGNAKISVKKDASSASEFIAEIGPGRCFGEDSLVNETIRNATVTMSTEGVLMRLEKSDFLLLLTEPLVDTVRRDELNDLMEEPTFIDVRTEDEYFAGHLPESANVPLSLLSIKKRLLAPEKFYIFYCDSGRRSDAAAYLLGKQGYNVVSLEKGLYKNGFATDIDCKQNYILRDGGLVEGQ